MELNAKTQLCGVIGNPVEHSLSPEIHNAAFQALGLNVVYVAFPVDDVAGAMQGVRGLGNIRGLSVTIPHKVSVMAHLDDIETTAKHIGSVNTVVVKDKKLIGYNTDASGALQALQEGSGSLDGKQVVVLGSGGAARAIAFGLAGISDLGGLTILGIDEKEREELVQDIQKKTGRSVEQGPLDDNHLARHLGQAQILVHCTPIGMSPKVEATVVPAKFLHPDLTVMDIVYNPMETRLLQEAQQAGCQVIRGVEMFLAQAVGQFELWTERAAPKEIMRAVLEKKFS